MPLLPIIVAPDPRLKQKAARVERVDADIVRLMDDMLETMYAAPGIGLAAPQVGVSRRVLVVDIAKTDEERTPLCMVNPEIVWLSDEDSVYEEGCLSVPEHYAQVARPSAVRVRYLDRENEIRELAADGLLATVVQHEMDHLDGILFIDHLSALKRNMILRKLTKARRDLAPVAAPVSPPHGNPLRLAFMGTPDFAVPVLAALVEAGHDVACVYSQPPRPAGRGHKEQLSPVHAFAAARGLAVRNPRSLKPAEEHETFRALGLDAAVVAAYGLILPGPVLAAPRLGCLNVHASLLPRWRGAAPIQRALLAGDAETGVTIMQMDAGLDTGAMLLSGTVPITATTTAQQLHDALAALGARLIVAALDAAAAGTLAPRPQPETGITYAHKLDKDEGRIDWRQPAAAIERMVRGLNPWPGVWCEAAGERLKVLAATPAAAGGAPGTVVAAPLVVACGDGALRLERVQRAGKGPMSADELVRGFALPVGTRLG